jgi:hypothetical protein
MNNYNPQNQQTYQYGCIEGRDDAAHEDDRGWLNTGVDGC